MKQLVSKANSLPSAYGGYRLRSAGFRSEGADVHDRLSPEWYALAELMAAKSSAKIKRRRFLCLFAVVRVGHRFVIEWVK